MEEELEVPKGAEEDAEGAEQPATGARGSRCWPNAAEVQGAASRWGGAGPACSVSKAGGAPRWRAWRGGWSAAHPGTSECAPVAAAAAVQPLGAECWF